MRPFATLLLATLLMAGCSSPSPQADGPTAPATTDDETVHGGIPMASVNGTTTAAPEAGTRLYRFGENLTFDHALRRYAIVAEGNVSFDLDLDLLAASVDRPANCLAFAVGAYDGNGTVFGGGSVVAWAGDATLTTQVTVAGQTVPVFADPLPGSAAITGLPITGSFEGNMTAGDRLVLQVGGARPTGHEQDIDLAITGPARLEALPDAPLACGRGVRDAGGDAGLATYIVTASIGGELTFATTTASTLIAELSAAPAQDVQVLFLDDAPRALDGELALTRGAAGTVGVRVGMHADTAGSLSWFFADAAWPVSAA